jgi:hypothetical protein
MIRYFGVFGAARCAVLALALVAVLIPSAARAAGCTTTVSSISATVTAVGAAAPGATVCLADGAYGELTLDVTKPAPGVTVRAANPGRATIDGASLSGARLTLAQFNVTDEIDLMPGSSGMVVEHNRISGGYMGVNLPTSSTQVNDAEITGNKFVGPFGEDAIRANRYHDADGDGVGLLVDGNEITNVRENGNHSDCLQAVWVGDHMVYRHNYLHDNTCQGLFIKDQASVVDTVIVEDNLMLRNNSGCGAPATSCGQPAIFQLFGPMTNLQVRRNTIWTPGGGSPTTLRDPGWAGARVFDSNVISRPWSDTTAPFGSGYASMNNVAGSAPEGNWPATGFTTVASPAFANPATDDYRTNGSRGVDWAPADQDYGPGGSTTTPPVDTPPADTTPPGTLIGSGPSASTTSTSASFEFSTTESGSTFACKLDYGAYAACTSPKTYSGLSTGVHTFSVRATDPAGNVDASPARQTWTIYAGTPPPPPTDRLPIAAFDYSPTAPITGQAVTFDASSATCADTPCTYAWIDDGNDGPAGGQWSLGTGKTLTFTFEGVGVKYVRLTVTDADGDKASILRQVGVTQY